MKKVIVLVLFLLCIPVIAYAAEGEPFKALQEQIAQLKIQLQNIQLTPGPLGPAGVAGPQGIQGIQGAAGVVDGVERVVYGVLAALDGYIIRSAGNFTWEFTYNGCNLDIDHQRCRNTIHFSRPFDAVPACTVTPFSYGGLPNVNVPSPVANVEYVTAEYVQFSFSGTDGGASLPWYAFICVE